MAISSYSNPIPEIIDGLLRGHQLGLQMQQAARADQEFKTQQAMHNQQMSMQDIFNKKWLQDNARPVSAMGTVQESLRTPDMPIAPGAPATGSSKTSDVYNLPQQPGPTMPGQSIDYQRKAEPSSTIQYAGQKHELKTPEEQDRAAIAKAQLLKRAGSTMIQTPPHLQKLGLPAQMYIPDDHLYQYAATTGELQPVQTPQAYQQMGGPAEVPLRNLPTVNTSVNEQLNRQARQALQDQAKKSAEGIAEQNRQSREKIAGQTAQSREKAAGIRAGGVEGRFEIRRSDAADALRQKAQQAALNRVHQDDDTAQRLIESIQTKEDNLHADMIKIGENLKSGTMSTQDAAREQDKLKALDFQVKAFQTRKAEILRQRQAARDQVQQSAPAPTAAPAAAPTGGPAPAPGLRGGTTTVKLPNGDSVTGTDEQIDAYMKAAGLTFQK